MIKLDIIRSVPENPERFISIVLIDSDGRWKKPQMEGASCLSSITGKLRGMPGKRRGKEDGLRLPPNTGVPCPLYHPVHTEWADPCSWALKMVKNGAAVG